MTARSPRISKDWTSNATNALTSWAIATLQPDAAGFATHSSIDKIGRVVDEVDPHYQDHTPRFREQSHSVRCTSDALHKLPPHIMQTIVTHWLATGHPREKAKELEIGFSTYQSRLSEGLSFVQGWLSAHDCLRKG